MKRRDFFKFGMATAASAILPILSRSGSFITGAFAADLTPLSETNSVALSLGYSEDNTKVDTKKWTKKAGADGKAQKCSSCMFFTKLDEKRGKCQIFPTNTVSMNGWCNSWTKKP